MVSQEARMTLCGAIEAAALLKRLSEGVGVSVLSWSGDVGHVIDLFPVMGRFLCVSECAPPPAPPSLGSLFDAEIERALGLHLERLAVGPDAGARVREADLHPEQPVWLCLTKPLS